MNSPATGAVQAGSIAAWRIALRPRTFPIAAVPVFVGTAFAWAQHGAHVPWVFALAIVGAVLVQAISNMQNDVGYTVRGGETGTRTGLPRATANGWLSVSAVRRAIVIAAIAAVAVGAPLMLYRGWPVALIVASSIAAAWAYMGGPKPIAYTPFGDLTVFLFFGLMAVCGTIYVQAGTIAPAGWLAGIAIGLLASSVLTVNNHRDIAHDATTGRRTLSVALGAAGSRAVYRTSVLGAFALVPAIAWTAGSYWYLMPIALLPRAFSLLAAFDTAKGGHALTPILFRTVILEAGFGVLLAAGAVVSRMA